MRFCKHCGKTVAIFNDANPDECPQCATPKPAPSYLHTEGPNCSPDLLAATLSIRDGKVILESREGALLWSGSGECSHSLLTILDRASKILAIRTRKKH